MALIEEMKARHERSPNNCAACDHKRRPDGGWCYMFRAEPSERCAQHTARKVLDLAQQNRKRLTMAAFDALTHADKRADLEQRAAVERAARQRL